MLYSKSTGGFYHPELHSQIPADAIEIPDAEYAMLISSCHQIVGTAKGRPVISKVALPMSVDRESATRLLATGISRTLNSVAKANSFGSIEEACSYTDGVFAADGQFFRTLRDSTRTNLLRLVSTLQDTQSMNEVSALAKELHDSVIASASEFVAVMPEEITNG